MGISTKARYALRIMSRLARLDTGASATIQDLSKAEDVSFDYAAQIMIAMRRAGLVASRRGVGGGISLSRAADVITVADVIEAADGPIRVVDCNATGSACRRSAVCVTRDVWQGATDLLIAYFQSITLKMLADRAQKQEAASPAMFDI